MAFRGGLAASFVLCKNNNSQPIKYFHNNFNTEHDIVKVTKIEMEEFTMSDEIAEYFAKYPTEVQEKMRELREIILGVLPDDVTELLSYGMPAYRTTKNVVYFGAAKHHLGFYPASPLVQDVFVSELADFKTTKGSIHFSYTEALPKELIENIVKFRLQEIAEVKK